MSNRSGGGSASGVPLMKDGEAVDRLSDRVERWAKKFQRANDEEGFLEGFEAKFRPEAEELARQCTPPARPFGLKEWIIAVPLWLILGAIVFVLSLLVMQPTGIWLWLFAAVGVLIAIIGIGYVYFDTTSEKRAAKRLADKTEWLLGVARRTGTDLIRGLNKR
ncbi:hypothetical protein [Gulosibacter chungangensis]|uniref:Uncharacterized protein n=1 Tax=Gulosibacter chungangensis TaxID=979746 RepID=A0A7J5BA03_9MICO|nr:hypothetical protein [Gulosibacter chungangensis]KAB1642676.1 hypothetical protein F8O05_09450 [Gulosibacter chungangensis]